MKLTIKKEILLDALVKVSKAINDFLFNIESDVEYEEPFKVTLVLHEENVIKYYGFNDRAWD